MGETSLPPQGFSHMPETGGFDRLIGDLYEKFDGENWTYCFLTTQKIQSSSGNVHGGFLMMAVDHLISLDILRRKDRPYHIATAQLESHFIDRTPVGIWVFGKPRILRRTRHLLFTDCEFSSENGLLFRATGIWKIVAADSRVARETAKLMSEGTWPAEKDPADQ
ncbi:PaaI family thioesterase [bacterium]|jgi:acyl-coenzyme A thioesterase PaaI-like protein|nr:PaaI family thioesterase [bacterium]